MTKPLNIERFHSLLVGYGFEVKELKPRNVAAARSAGPTAFAGPTVAGAP